MLIACLRNGSHDYDSGATGLTLPQRMGCQTCRKCRDALPWGSDAAGSRGGSTLADWPAATLTLDAAISSHR